MRERKNKAIPQPSQVTASTTAHAKFQPDPHGCKLGLLGKPFGPMILVQLILINVKTLLCLINQRIQPAWVIIKSRFDLELFNGCASGSSRAISPDELVVWALPVWEQT